MVCLTSLRIQLAGLAAASAMVAFAAADTDLLIRQVSVYEWGKDPSAVRQLDAEVLSSAGTAQAAPLEQRIAAALAGAKTLAARDAYCRYLSVIGTSGSVPALAPLLLNADTVEMARYALERIPGDAASDALRQALPQAPARAKPGIVVSLGRRRDVASVKLIRGLLASPDARLAQASATALAHIATPEARQALLTATPGPAIEDALLLVASADKGADAARIYKRLENSDNEAVRVAVIHGLAQTERARSVPILERALKTGTPKVRDAAIRELAALDRSVLAKHAGLAPVQVLTALADSGGTDVLPVVERYIADESAPVRVAALNGLAKIGATKRIDEIAARAAATTGEEQAAARSVLAGLRAAGADAAIVQAIPNAAPKVKAELIRAVGERGIQSATDTLLKTATDPDRAVRAESIRALRETAGSAHVSSLLALLVKTDDENERKEYERAAAFAIRRSKEARVDDVVRSFNAASDDDVKASLLAVLASVGNNDALPVIREALKSGNSEVQRAAINAFASWPTADPKDDLLAIAQTSTNAAQQVLALRGFVKLVQIPSNRTPAETARLLERAMAAAKRPDEKKLVIAAAQRVMAPESLELVKRSLEDPAVAAEARQAQTALERGLSYRRN